MKIRYLVIMILLFIMQLYPGQRDSIQWWITNYGDYSKTRDGKSDIKVRNAFEVFNKIKNVADKMSSRNPKLIILNTNGNPYALSLPDGGVIISKGTLRICFNNVSNNIGKVRLAFVFGHEMSHLANNDFNHREAFVSVKKYVDYKKRYQLLNQLNYSKKKISENNKVKEIFADQRGILYTLMAGYHPNILFNKKGNFFKFWVNQIGIGNNYDSSHPSPEKRSIFVKLKLKEVVDKFELYKLGIYLYQAGNFDDALNLFSEFSKIFPSKEVFNNIGSCYFIQARKRLFQIDKKAYFRFNISVSISSELNLKKLMKLRGITNYKDDLIFKKYTNNAIESFKKALSMDPNNKELVLNLSSAYILNEEYADALAIINKPINRNIVSSKIFNNKAIALYLYGKKEGLDTGQKSLKLLERASILSPKDSEILYNFAIMLDERKRSARAKKYWTKYLKIAPRNNYYAYIINQSSENIIEKTNAKFPKSGFKIKPGDVINKSFDNYHKNEFNVGDISFSLINKGNYKIIIIDDFVELIIKKLKNKIYLKSILNKFGLPKNIVRLNYGNFYVYKNFSFREFQDKAIEYIWFGSN